MSGFRVGYPAVASAGSASTLLAVAVHTLNKGRLTMPEAWRDEMIQVVEALERAERIEREARTEMVRKGGRSG